MSEDRLLKLAGKLTDQLQKDQKQQSKKAESLFRESKELQERIKEFEEHEKILSDLS